MINRVVLVGRLTKDPELRYTSTNLPVATFTLAVNRTFTNQSGEREADFIQCVIWRKQAENLAKYVGKGSLIGVDGRIQTRSYDSKEGTRRYITEVVCDSVQFLESRTQDNSNYEKPQANNYYEKPQTNNYNEKPQTNNTNQNKYQVDISDDDLPF